MREKTTQTTRLADGSYVNAVYQDNHLGYDALGHLDSVIRDGVQVDHRY